MSCAFHFSLPPGAGPRDRYCCIFTVGKGKEKEGTICYFSL